MDEELMRSIVNRFDKNAFETFFQALLNQPGSSYNRPIYRAALIDDSIFEDLMPEFQYAHAFIMNYKPYEIYKNFTLPSLDLPNVCALARKYLLQRVYKYLPWINGITGVTFYVIHNFDSEKIGISDKVLLEECTNALAQLHDTGRSFTIGMGNINTYFRTTEVAFIKNILTNFLENNNAGLRISFSDNEINTSRFWVENEFPGITQNSSSILQPIIIKLTDTNDILSEFKKLIFSDAKESVMEDFLRVNYKAIFGSNYDRISTQLWLKFPDIDIGNRNRRLDIMMRNANSSDWELFELKRSNVRLTKTISDVPMFVSAVHDAITQAKNYKRLLEQDKVKRALAQEGIEYYYPEINLVIGQKPSVSNSQWRSLLADNQNGLKILTYDALIKEAQRRYADYANFLK